MQVRYSPCARGELSLLPTQPESRLHTGCRQGIVPHKPAPPISPVLESQCLGTHGPGARPRGQSMKHSPGEVRNVHHGANLAPEGLACAGDTRLCPPLLGFEIAVIVAVVGWHRCGVQASRGKGPLMSPIGHAAHVVAMAYMSCSLGASVALQYHGTACNATLADRCSASTSLLATSEVDALQHGWHD